MVKDKWELFLNIPGKKINAWVSYFVKLTDNAENKLKVLWEGPGCYGAYEIVKSIKQDHPSPSYFTLSQLGQLHEHIWNFNPPSVNNPKKESKCAHAVSALAFLINDKIEFLLQLAISVPEHFAINKEELDTIKNILQQEDSPNDLLIKVREQLDSKSFENLERALLNYEKVQCISLNAYEYNHYLDKPKTQNKFNKYVYNVESNTLTVTLIEAKRIAINQIICALNKNDSDEIKLKSIEDMISNKELDVLSKADTRGEVFLKMLQQLFDPIIKTLGFQLWKDRIQDLKEVLSENKPDSPTKS